MNKFRLCLESVGFMLIQFAPFFFANIDFLTYSLLYVIHQNMFYIYHRFGHQWFDIHRTTVHKLHHVHRRFHTIIEPFGFFLYAVFDQIVPYLLFSYDYAHLIFYFTFIEHIVAHGCMHLFNLEGRTLHLFHHKYPLQYQYMGGNLLWDWLYGSLPLLKGHA